MDFATAISDAIGKDYNILNPRLEKHLREYGSQRVGMINSTTREALHKALDADDPVTAVHHVFEVARTSRATMIATTEVVRTSNWSAIDAGKWVGELDLKRWASLMDGHERHTHHEMHNQIVGWNENFVSPSGARGPTPGQLGQPDEDIGCRCSALPARSDQRSELDDYGDAVTLYEDLRRPFVDRLEGAWRQVFDEQEAAVLAELGR